MKSDLITLVFGQKIHHNSLPIERISFPTAAMIVMAAADGGSIIGSQEL